MCPCVHLVPGHLRPQFRDQLCGRVISFAAACPGHQRGGAVNRSPNGCELAPGGAGEGSLGLPAEAVAPVSRPWISGGKWMNDGKYR